MVPWSSGGVPASGRDGGRSASPIRRRRAIEAHRDVGQAAVTERKELGMADERTIEALLEEKRTLPPPKEFAARATANDSSIYEQGSSDPEGFWASEAARLQWSKPWET